MNFLINYFFKKTMLLPHSISISLLNITLSSFSKILNPNFSQVIFVF